MSGGKIILAGTVCVAAVVVKVVHDMQVQERAEMKSGVERDRARILEKKRRELAAANASQPNARPPTTP